MFNVSLPNEITYEIVAEVICARNIRRVQRLRLVSKTWKAWVDEVQVQTGSFLACAHQFMTHPFGHSRCSAMAEATSLEIHQRLFPLAIGELHVVEYYLHSLGRHMVLMARRGALPILQSLLQLDSPASVSWAASLFERPRLLREAARHGQTETVRWLLEGGRDADAELESAAHGGNPAVMRLLVRRCGGGTSQGALRTALEREHVGAARVLLRSEHFSGRRIEDDLMEDMRRGGLESMEKLLREHNAGIASTP